MTSGVLTSSGALGDALVDRMNRVNDSESKPKRWTVIARIFVVDEMIFRISDMIIHRHVLAIRLELIGLQGAGDPHLGDVSPGAETEERGFLAFPTETPNPLDERGFDGVVTGLLGFHGHRNHHRESLHVPVPLLVADADDLLVGEDLHVSGTQDGIRHPHGTHAVFREDHIAGSPGQSRCWMTEPPGGSSN